jgi:hypothetical protein
MENNCGKKEIIYIVQLLRFMAQNYELKILFQQEYTEKWQNDTRIGAQATIWATQ